MSIYTRFGLSKNAYKIIIMFIFIGLTVQQCTVPSIINGRYSNCTAGAHIAVNQSCTVTCDAGYRIADATITCGADNDMRQPTCTESSCYSSESCLKDDLFDEYDSTVRPSLHPLDTLNVTVSLFIRALTGIDERNEIMTIIGWLTLQWHDEHLMWNPDSYEHTRQMVMIASQLWLPDCVIINSAESYYKSTYKDDFRAMVRYDGQVNWRFGGHLSTTCSLDITFYPFDTQECVVAVKNWLYPSSMVNLITEDNAIDRDGFVEHGLWDMKHASAQRIYEESPGSSQVIFKFDWKRKPDYYVFNIILPTLFIVCITLGQFWLPAGSGEKVSLGITILLAFSVFQIIIAESTPVNSDTSPVISRMVLFVMSMATISLVFAIVAVYLDSKTDATRVPKYLRIIAFHGLARVLFVSGREASEDEPGESNRIRPVSSQAISIDENKEHNKYSNTYLSEILEAVNEIRHYMNNTEQSENIVNEWKLLSKIIDRLMFWISTLVVVIYFVIFALEIQSAD